MASLKTRREIMEHYRKGEYEEAEKKSRKKKKQPKSGGGGVSAGLGLLNRRLGLK